MTASEHIEAGVKNAYARTPKVDPDQIERTLRKTNRSVGRDLGRIEWSGSLAAYIRRTADLVLEGWTIDDQGPLSPPLLTLYGSGGRGGRLETLPWVEQQLWTDERSAHSGARLTPSRRLPVYLNAIDAPQTCSSAALLAVDAARTAATTPEPRTRDFAQTRHWKWHDDHWSQARAAAALPYLAQIAECFAHGLYAATLLRRGATTRTILIARPRLRVQAGRLHAPDTPAVIWPDGSGSWYWQGVAVPDRIAAARDQLTAELVAGIDNQELRRVAVERLGWERFLQTADAQLRAQDDYGKLWATTV